MKYFLFTALVLAFSIPLKSSGQATIAMPTDTISLGQAAPDFTLKDINGKNVSLATFKGKVVILDFWATWCVPCHENFPAMKKAVDHYKSDKDVVFLFIDTRERSTDYVRLAKEDMAKNKYDFQVLFDEAGKEGKQDKYYKIFGMWGIPTEFILDRNGIIRYKLVGYDSDLTNDQRADGVIKQVELVKTLS
ncbi:TlpA family protein disulfide reductase [Mucilaginibacter jinjuensis]|uniref:TlpA disulfide reductase family protein n=1 Tax=Mucilaginibacter jinjuensis TaxID=1176721 RepID=A0ABY7TCN7_9SPHI|nr:TlpA disulfide reductase family protein [Mucilaginibacter jinjuensis]WCT13392.1 TlpA disulfide reductase family protein [Mucilaginibacter jinjuensis]